MMTVDEVEEKVNHIKAIVDDIEGAHWRENKVHIEVLQAIASGAPNPQELAKAALKTLDLIKERGDS